VLPKRAGAFSALPKRSAMRVLLIEDDVILGESLTEYLQTFEISIDWLRNEREYEEQLIANSYDLIILDLMLRYLTGEDILKKIRGKGIETPILILTAKNNITDKERCFGYGADDYLTKPFELRELISRIKALSKRRHVDNIIQIQDVKVDMEAGVLYKEGKEINVSKRTWDLLYLLITHRGQIVKCETILNYVWGDNPVGDEIIRTYIKQLRKILPIDSISTHKCRGYKLNE
jgi:DNA-binding response OmpR family regulator